MAKAPLEGIRVANFGWVWAGPVVGQTLAFLGAEVYKIESSKRVDLTRAVDISGMGLGIGPTSYAGQGSVSLNLKSPEGKKLAFEIIAKSDIFVENFGPGVADKMGFSYKNCKEANPNIIYLSMPTAGNYGSLKDVRTYGTSLASICGFDSFTGYPGEDPQQFEQAVTDPYNGLLGAYAALCALAHRNKTGEGQFIDYSQQQAVVQMMGPALMNYFMNGRNQPQMGNRTPFITAAPHGCFRSKGDDKWISIVCYEEAEWQGLVAAMGNPDWATHAAFATAESRLQNIDALHAKLNEWTQDFEHYALAETLQKHGVAAAPVTDMVEVVNDPHFKARKTFSEMTYQPNNVKATGYGHYIKMSKSEQHFRPSPALGEDNEYVFKELLGLSEDEYNKLVEADVIS